MAVFRIALIAGLLASCSVHAQAPPFSSLGGPLTGGGIAGPRSVTLTANLAATGYTVPADFVGYSFELTGLVPGNYLTGSGSLCSLAGLIGTSGSIRIGGISSDGATPPALTQPIANGLESFRACLGSGWKIIYGLDLVAANSTTAATQAGFLNTASGSNVIFQFGNEPIDGSNFTVSTYQTAWNAYQTAVTGAVPSAKLAAWDDGNFGQTQTAINGLTGGLAGLTYVTQHYYNSPCSVAESASVMIGKMIINTTIPLAAGLSAILQNVGWATASSIKTRMTESNTICSGGVAGSSDRMMAAAWYLNEAILLANGGYNGVNTHNVFWWPASGGAPIIGTANPNTYGALLLSGDGNFYPGSIFYGLYLFSKIEGQQTISLSQAGNGFVQSIASKGGGGNANILAVNNDLFNPVVITPAQSSAWTTANVLQIKSPSGAGCTEASPTVGGQAIGESGAWSGAPFSIANGASVTLGPCEAALIQIQP